MRRDPIFYQLFRQSPTLLFELISQPPIDAEMSVMNHQILASKLSLNPKLSIERIISIKTSNSQAGQDRS
jgi:predicted transposase YdaD